MKIKKLMATLAAVTLVVAMAACNSTPVSSTPGSSSNSSSTAAQDVKMRMGWWGSQTRHDRTIAVIEMYESLNKVDIEYEFYAFEGYITKLNTLVASNDVWDIFQLGGNYPTYIDKIEPMEDYITRGLIDVKNIPKMFLVTTQDQNTGKQLGLSSGINTYGIAYDPALFLKAGVAEPTATWTWDDYKKACLTIHEKLGIFGSSKLDDFIAGCSLNIPQESYALNFFNKPNNGLGFTDYAMLTPYIQMRSDLVKAGAYPDPGQIAEIKDIEGDYLVTGKAAMTWIASNQFIAISTAAKRPLKLAVLPRKKTDGPSGMTVQSSQMLCIAKDSDFKDEAAKFISYFQNDTVANRILLGERGVPISTIVRESLQNTATAEQTMVFEYVDLVGTFKTGDYINVINPTQQVEIKDKYNELLEQVIFGQKTADVAAKEIFTFATAAFK